MVAVVMDRLVLIVCSYICHNTLYLLVEKPSFSVLKVFAIEQLVSNTQQFKKCLAFLRHGVHRSCKCSHTVACLKSLMITMQKKTVTRKQCNFNDFQLECVI